MSDALALQAYLDRIPYGRWLGLRAQGEGDRDGVTARFLLVGEQRHLGNPILNAWHGGILSGSLQVAMAATLMRVGAVEEPPALFEHTTRYVGSSPISKPLTIDVRLVKHGKRIAFVEAEAYHEPGKTVVTAQASFAGKG